MNTLAFFSNVFTGGDGIIILIIVLVIFGPKKLPELARGMGQAIKEFHKAKEEISREITSADVNVQPAPGQQPIQSIAAAPAAQPVQPIPPVSQPAPIVAQPAPPAANQQLFSAGETFQRPNPAEPAARPVEDTHPAGQA